jgi:hypothetical protein
MPTERTLAPEVVEDAVPGRFWGDQWLRVSEKLLKGLNHQFTNRLTALGAILDLMHPASPPPQEVIDALAEEVARLGRLLLMYRSLSTDGLASMEATRLQDAIPMALSLHEQHPDLKSLACRVVGEPDSAPTLIRQASLLRALLVLLESVAGNAMRSGREREVQVTYGSMGDEVFVRFDASAPDGQTLFAGPGSLLYTVRRELAHASGSAEGTLRGTGPGRRITYEIRLPTLAAARRTSAPGR